MLNAEKVAYAAWDKGAFMETPSTCTPRTKEAEFYRGKVSKTEAPR